MKYSDFQYCCISIPEPLEMTVVDIKEVHPLENDPAGIVFEIFVKRIHTVSE